MGNKIGAKVGPVRPDKGGASGAKGGRMIQYEPQCHGQWHLFADPKKGDRVVVIAEYSITLVALFSATQKIGFCHGALNYRLAAPEIKEISEDAGPVLIFTKITSPIYCPNPENIYAYEMHVLEAVRPQPHFDVKK